MHLPAAWLQLGLGVPLGLRSAFDVHSRHGLSCKAAAALQLLGMYSDAVIKESMKKDKLAEHTRCLDAMREIVDILLKADDGL